LVLLRSVQVFMIHHGRDNKLTTFRAPLQTGQAIFL
jgi:hypothetical protein